MDKARIDRVLKAACEQLDGDWVLLGGALAALWFSPSRKTEDIDLVSLKGRAGERLQLMELASLMGLPVEAVNSAADFFLKKLPGWRRELVLFRKGPRSRIFRLTPTAFLLLKVGRLDEADLSDCIHLLRMCKKKGLPVDVRRALDFIASAQPTEDEPLRIRRARLVEVLERFARDSRLRALC